MIDSEKLLSGMGARIVERRKQLNLSQEELAERAEISVQMLSTAERGAKAIRPINLLKISQALNISSDYLLTGSETSIDNFLLESKLNSLNHKQRVALENIIDNFISVCKKSEDED
ncbi:MAG: helix-turn-helix transcriptional regulator [Eubacteriales bacterium]|jgi:transcriptional regulator with XRE-family HTH domain|nr:helix-turn-helix transcriptional regulator [Eubacteriales bacterium]HCG34936.1 XRE family transcriptional regulator [Clostridiales bacterium]